MTDRTSSTRRAMRFSHADRRRAHRPKPAKPADNPRLFQVVEEKLVLGWSPSPISRWVMETCPDDEEMRVSQNTIRAPAHIGTYGPPVLFQGGVARRRCSMVYSVEAHGPQNGLALRKEVDVSKTIVLLVAALLLTIGCTSSDPTSSEEYLALEQAIAGANQEAADAKQAMADAEAELDQVTAERDALAMEISVGAARFEKSAANAARVEAIIDDPDEVGTREEVLDELTTLATPDAVMDDTAFGSVPIRQAWSNTLWGSDATIKTWVTWMCADGSQAGSLWTWAGESPTTGASFELIGVNLDDYDDEGRVTYSLVDWPYDRAYVREAFASGNTTSD
jgi:hypothetical protein